MRYTKEDIKNSLLKLGIKPNDTIFFSTSLGMVGIPPSYVKNQDDLNKLFLDVLREVLYDGRIIVPTYSYTFGKSIASNLAIFDKDTKAEIGSFPNYCLKQKDAIRSLDPFMSVVCIGKDCKEFLDGISNISYGRGSFFEKLVFQGGKCCSIGLGPNWTPFIHYADYLAKVPHRYDKLFWGYIKTNKKLIKIPWIYSVRFVGDESYPYAHIAGREAEKEGIWKYSNLGRARVYLADCKSYFDFVMDKLKQNPWYLAKGPAIDVIQKEKQRINYQTLHKKSVMSGEWVDNFLVPERWNYKKAYLLDSKNSIISTTPWIHSLSINKTISKEELKKHISFYPKNCYLNRDWGFVLKEELKDEVYQVVIESEFGKGEVYYENEFFFIEEWQQKYDINLKKKMFFDGRVEDFK